MAIGVGSSFGVKTGSSTGHACTILEKTQDSHLLEELPISPAPNRQDPAEYQWGAVLAGALR